jgi:hypothetical protein
MTNLTSYSLNFKDMKFSDGDFVKSNYWPQIIKESGYVEKTLQYMSFDYLGIESVVMFDMAISGKYSYDSGDYNTPSYEDVDLDEPSININSMTIDGYDVELTSEIVNLLKEAITQNL